MKATKTTPSKTAVTADFIIFTSYHRIGAYVYKNCREFIALFMVFL